MQLVFQLADEIVLIKILGNTIWFSNSSTNFQKFAPIEGLRLKKEGILKEFPDLEGLELVEMRQKAIERFKDKIKTLDSEPRIKDYIVNEMIKMGYTLKSIQREGFRPEKIGK